MVCLPTIAAAQPAARIEIPLALQLIAATPKVAANLALTLAAMTETTAATMETTAATMETLAAVRENPAVCLSI